jgi:hypothetical protein
MSNEIKDCREIKWFMDFITTQKIIFEPELSLVWKFKDRLQKINVLELF